MTDLQLQKVLAKMLPGKIRMSKRHGPVWIEENAVVEHTEWWKEQTLERLKNGLPPELKQEEIEV